MERHIGTTIRFNNYAVLNIDKHFIVYLIRENYADSKQHENILIEFCNYPINIKIQVS